MIQELYKFERYVNSSDVTPTDTWTYTSADVSVTYGADSYAKRSMGRGSLTIRSQASKNALSVSFSKKDTFAQYWLSECEFSTLLLTITEKDDTTYSTLFKGKLHQVQIGQYITLVFESDFSTLQRIGTGKVYSRTCQHALYSQDTFNCGVDKSGFAVSGTVTNIASGRYLTIAAASGYDDHYFTFGIMVDGEGAYNYINSHNGNIVVVNKLSPFIVSDVATNGSSDVTLYPGCTKSRRVCDDRFSNSNNFGGQPWIPAYNPWDKNIIV